MALGRRRDSVAACIEELERKLPAFQDRCGAVEEILWCCSPTALEPGTVAYCCCINYT